MDQPIYDDTVHETFTMSRHEYNEFLDIKNVKYFIYSEKLLIFNYFFLFETIIIIFLILFKLYNKKNIVNFFI